MDQQMFGSSAELELEAVNRESLSAAEPKPVATSEPTSERDERVTGASAPNHLSQTDRAEGPARDVDAVSTVCC